MVVAKQFAGDLFLLAVEHPPGLDSISRRPRPDQLCFSRRQRGISFIADRRGDPDNIGAGDLDPLLHGWPEEAESEQPFVELRPDEEMMLPAVSEFEIGPADGDGCIAAHRKVIDDEAVIVPLDNLQICQQRGIVQG